MKIKFGKIISVQKRSSTSMWSRCDMIDRCLRASISFGCALPRLVFSYLLYVLTKRGALNECNSHSRYTFTTLAEICA